MNAQTKYVVTCEHGGNDVPREFAGAFSTKDAQAWLPSHRGYDPGSLTAANQIAAELGVDLISSTVTRLLVDLNRSLDNATLFSRFTRGFSESKKNAILNQYYHPYRTAVSTAIEQIVDAGQTAVHLSVHTFTPRIAGQWRPIDLGLLFDPDAATEASLCHRWQEAYAAKYPKRRVRLNEPYAGIADGLTTLLRTQFDSRSYCGIEIEINNRFFKRSPESQSRIIRELMECL